MRALSLGLVLALLLAPLAAGAASWDSSTWDSSTWDSSTWDSSTWDSSTWDSSTWDSASWDSASWDSGTWDSSTWDSSSWDQATWGFEALGLPFGAPLAATPSLACVVDSGIDATHPAFAGRLWIGPDGAPGRSWIGPGLDDPAGHGTHVAGILAAAGGARIASAKVLDAQGVGRTEDVADAIGWCVSIGADVILLALSESAPTKDFERAVARATKSALVVASAGNAGPCRSCLSSPASLPQVLAVGALDADGQLASFSADGPHLDALAPGVGIVSAAPGGGARAASGTSQAAALVAAAATLRLASDPEATPHEVEKALVRALG